MKTCNQFQIFLVAAIVLFIASLSCSWAAKPTKTPPPAIDAAIVDFKAIPYQAVISGRALLGDEPKLMTISIGGETVQTFSLQTSEQIDFVIPADISKPGTYLMTLTTDRGQVNYELAIGEIGPRGLQGIQGEPGPQGSTGSSGINSLLLLTEETSGSNCSDGGTKVQTGLDQNRNNILEITEILQTEYVCNGASSNGSGYEPRTVNMLDYAFRSFDTYNVFTKTYYQDGAILPGNDLVIWNELRGDGGVNHYWSYNNFSGLPNLSYEKYNMQLIDKGWAAVEMTFHASDGTLRFTENPDHPTVYQWPSGIRDVGSSWGEGYIVKRTTQQPDGTVSEQFNARNTMVTILGFEDVTVPAGTFNDCIKLYRIRAHAPDTTMWYSKDVGMVKRVYANDNGLQYTYELRDIVTK